MNDKKTVENIIDKMYQINQSITSETIEKASKEDLKKYLNLVNELKVQLIIATNKKGGIV